MKNYKYGIQKGIPIFLGYLPVSFTFGFMAVSGGLPVWLAVFISVTNLTSAGQFAGTNLIFAQAGYLEIALTTFVINLRYSLMSLSLSQKIDHRTPIWKRLIFSFGITDETFVVASMENGTLSAGYLLGLMGIGLYAMFIALIVPASREKKEVFLVVLMAVLFACLLKYTPVLRQISSGFRVIIATILAAGIGAFLFPKEEEEENP